MNFGASSLPPHTPLAWSLCDTKREDHCLCFPDPCFSQTPHFLKPHHPLEILSIIHKMSTDPTSTPLLEDSRVRNNSTTTSLAVLLGRATGRRGASMLVRETAARALEERRADWGYSKPVVALDMLWNLAFVFVSVVMLSVSVDESPNVPVRVWICGYALQCLVHVVLVWLEYRRRRGSQQELNSDDDDERAGVSGISTHSSVAKRCESLNTMASFLWWIVGFYWVISGGEILLLDAPCLYWHIFLPSRGF